MSSRVPSRPEPGSSTEPGRCDVPADGPNEAQADPEGPDARHPDATVRTDAAVVPPVVREPGCESSSMWADIWRAALQAGFDTTRRDPDVEPGY